MMRALPLAIQRHKPLKKLVGPGGLEPPTRPL
jgi:hypothetical protein